MKTELIERLENLQDHDYDGVFELPLYPNERDFLLQALTSVKSESSEEWWKKNCNEAMDFVGSCEVITKEQFIQAMHDFANEDKKQHAIDEYDIHILKCVEVFLQQQEVYILSEDLNKIIKKIEWKK